MSLRLLALGAAVALFAVWLTRPASLKAPDATPVDSAARRPEPRVAPAVPVRLARDPFRYEDAPPRAPAPITTLEAPPSQEPAAATTPEPVRLSGFVRQGGRLKAVLAVNGTTVLAGVGEAAEGYRVIAVDEDSGVRLRASSGEELLLRPSR